MEEINVEMMRKRKELGLTLAALSRLIGCSTNHLGNMERGERPFMDHWVDRINSVYNKNCESEVEQL